jgi:hypothetical protein
MKTWDGQKLTLREYCDDHLLRQQCEYYMSDNHQCLHEEHAQDCTQHHDQCTFIDIHSRQCARRQAKERCHDHTSKDSKKTISTIKQKLNDPHNYWHGYVAL